MRITENMTLAAARRGQAQATRRMADASRVAASGQRVSAPSEDAVAWSSAVGHESRIQRMEGRLRTSDRVIADPGPRGVDALERRRPHGAREGARGARRQRVVGPSGAREALGREVTDIRNAMVALADTRGAGGYIFGGTRSDAAPFDALGAFSGNDVETRVEVADGVTARSNASGARAFTGHGRARHPRGPPDARQRVDGRRRFDGAKLDHVDGLGPRAARRRARRDGPRRRRSAPPRR